MRKLLIASLVAALTSTVSVTALPTHKPNIKSLLVVQSTTGIKFLPIYKPTARKYMLRK